MRVFGSDRIKSMMGRFGIPEDQPIENRFIGKSLESAQAKIEGFHFDARKQTLEYDDVMNHQRQAIYERRQKMMVADKKEVDILLDKIIEERSARPHENSGVGGEEGSGKIIEEKKAKLGEEAFYETVRRIALYATDALWMEHLEAMDYLRSSVNLRAYGQREPIIEYKKEGLTMFKEMEINFREQVFSLISTITEPAKIEVNEPKQTLVVSHNEPSELGGKKDTNVGRNDPCPCGSGKKYKKCHGA
jgi:preprotein translocase subunit SecA